MDSPLFPNHNLPLNPHLSCLCLTNSRSHLSSLSLFVRSAGSNPRLALAWVIPGVINVIFDFITQKHFVIPKWSDDKESAKKRKKEEKPSTQNDFSNFYGQPPWQPPSTYCSWPFDRMCPGLTATPLGFFSRLCLGHLSFMCWFPFPLAGAQCLVQVFAPLGHRLCFWQL